MFLRSDPEVNRYIIRPTPTSLEDAVDFIQNVRGNAAKTDQAAFAHYWSIQHQSAPTMIGAISLWHFSDDRKTAELGYDLHPSFHRQGLMTEAIQRVVSFASDELGVTYLEAFTQRDNAASVGLLEKNGFVLLEDRVDEGNLKNGIFGRSLS